MPLTINVGLNRKTSQNYNSEGCSINLTAELDHSLLHDPPQLQDQINRLYAEAEDALDRQTQTAASAPTRPTPTPSDRVGRRAPEPTSNNRSPRSTSSGGGGGSGGGMTQSQRRAVFAIAGKLGIDPEDEAQQAFGLELEAMTLREASQLIDHLKGLQQGPAQGARR